MGLSYGYQYIKFAGGAIQIYSDKPKFYVLAATWEFERMEILYQREVNKIKARRAMISLDPKREEKEEIEIRNRNGT
ncbi:hypothetical protein Glove_74g222 [Diversispora epigaea]|uniref:Uncharacterized protein n=1 Tax=Diversispora epigaea TaxID=1348612 RepID=A0A397JCU4_9GLOM|nr:hypothetical protein Glove_74g222 [Diversispora epigaea]